MELIVNNTGDKELAEFLKQMQVRVKHTDAAMRTCALTLWQDQMKHFRNQEGPDGKWKPLSPVTLMRRRGSGKGAKILQDTGILRTSLIYQGRRDDAVVYTDMEYAATHQYGDPDRNIPQRKFLWISKEARQKCIERILRWFVKGI